jgi:DNA-binding protein YbaB
LIAEMAFTVIAAQAQSMMNAAQLPDELRFKLWAETVMTATYLNNLVIVTLNGEKKT